MPNNENLFARIQQVMQNSPDSVLLELENGTELSYAEMDSLSARLANLLCSCGLKAGDRITVQCEKNYRVVVLYLACLRAGVIFHPLNLAYTTKELEYFLQDAKPTLVVCELNRLTETTKLAASYGIQNIFTLNSNDEYSLWSQINELASEFETVHLHESDPAMLIYTSGTTGKPKGAVITHQNIYSNTMSLNQIWDWQSDDVLLHVLPLFHVHGLCVGLHCPLLSGAKIIFQSKFSVQRSLQRIPDSTVMMAVPTIYTRLLTNAKLSADLCKSMRLFISGSAPLLPETFEEFEQRTGHRILERYGMTEAQMIASNPLAGTRVAGTVGYALPGVKLRVTDQDGKIFEKNNKVGMLEIKGPNVFAGYWQKSQDTKKAFREDGYFITGDFALIDDSNRISIVGRHSDLIISAGFNIYPREVEIALNSLPSVTDSAVFGVPHRDLGEAVAAMVICSNHNQSELEMMKSLQEELSEFKIPKRIIFSNKFPRNAMGKIQKNRLRENYKHLFDHQS